MLGFNLIDLRETKRHNNGHTYQIRKTNHVAELDFTIALGRETFWNDQNLKILLQVLDIEAMCMYNYHVSIWKLLFRKTVHMYQKINRKSARK